MVVLEKAVIELKKILVSEGHAGKWNARKNPRSCDWTQCKLNSFFMWRTCIQINIAKRSISPPSTPLHTLPTMRQWAWRVSALVPGTWSRPETWTSLGPWQQSRWSTCFLRNSGTRRHYVFSCRMSYRASCFLRNKRPSLMVVKNIV